MNARSNVCVFRYVLTVCVDQESVSASMEAPLGHLHIPDFLSAFQLNRSGEKEVKQQEKE